MIFVTGLSKRQQRIMVLLGLPWLITAIACSQRLSPIWYVLFGFVSLIPYSFFYVRAHAIVSAGGNRPSWRFYLGVVVVEVLIIALLWVLARI